MKNNIWKLSNWTGNIIINNPECRKGLRLRFDKDIKSEVKDSFLGIARWLRSNYSFPMRVPVYVKSSVRVKARDGDYCAGIFFEPYHYNDEPYIRIATGDYDTLVQERGVLQAKIALLFPLLHELTHYYQWINSVELTEIGKERQANRYAQEVMEDYIEYLGLGDCIRQPDDISKLSDRIRAGNNDCKDEIERLSNDRNPFVRQQLAILLAENMNRHAVEVLKRLACDKNYLVQTEALGSLMGVSEEGIKDIVCQCMNSPHPLVRGYAYRCLSETNENVKIIRQHLQMVVEKNTWARIMLFIGEARVGDSTKIQKLTKMFSKCNYLNRCAIFDGIADIYEDLSQSDKSIVNIFVYKHKMNAGSATEDEAFSRLLRICKIGDN